MSVKQTEQAFIQRYPLLLFFGLSLVIGWSGWGLYALKLYFMPIIGNSTTLAALIMTVITEGGNGLKKLLRQWVSCITGIKWYVRAVTWPVWIVGLSLIVCLIAGVKLENLTRLAAPQVFVGLLAVYLVSPLNTPIGEELGWCAYFMPQVLRLVSPGAAAWLMGGMWVVWHIPLFSQQEQAFILPHILLLLAQAALFTGLYIRTRFNVPVAIIWHANYNALTVWIAPVFMSSGDIYLFWWAQVAANGIAALAISVKTAKRGAK